MLDSVSSDERGSINTIKSAEPEVADTPQPEMGVSYIDDDPSDGESIDDEEDDAVTEKNTLLQPVSERETNLEPARSIPDPVVEPVARPVPDVQDLYATPRPRPPCSPSPDANSQTSDTTSTRSYGRQRQPLGSPGVREVEDERGLHSDGGVASSREVHISSPGNVYEEPGDGLVVTLVMSYCSYVIVRRTSLINEDNVWSASIKLNDMRRGDM